MRVTPQSVLLLSPPGFGKTTLLREWVRLVSDAGHAVAVADERGEIAALSDGAPQFAVGRCTDVLENCAKQQAALMLLKTMSPELIAFDEITAPEDVEAVSLCAHCGTAVLASAHAADVDDLCRRPLYRALLELHVFERAVVITREEGKRRYRMEKMEGSTMLKLMGSVMIFGACAALGLSARQGLRRRGGGSGRNAAGAPSDERRNLRPPHAGARDSRTAGRERKPDYPDGVRPCLRRRLREENGLSLGYLWRSSLRDCRDQVGLGQPECEILSEAAAWLGRYDAAEQVAGLEQIARRLAAARDTAAGELQNKGNLYRTCGIALGILVVLVLI